MCQYNLRVKDSQGEGLLKKATTLMVNSEAMSQYLGRTCQGGHQHQQVKGGRRSVEAAIYTKEFCEAILEALQIHQLGKKATGDNKNNLPKT